MAVMTTAMHRHRAILICLPLILLLCCRAGATENDDFDSFEQSIDAHEFDDQPLAEPLGFPDFFKLSFLDLREDLEDAW